MARVHAEAQAVGLRGQTEVWFLWVRAKVLSWGVGLAPEKATSCCVEADWEGWSLQPSFFRWPEQPGGSGKLHLSTQLQKRETGGPEFSE